MTIQEFENEIWNNAYLTRINMDQILEPIAKKCGLTVLQCLVLGGICQGRFRNVTDICCITRMNQSNASAICKKLETMGLLKKERCPDNKRKVILVVTESGKERIAVMEAQFEHFLPLLEQITDEEKEMLCIVQRRINKLMEQMRRVLADM